MKKSLAAYMAGGVLVIGMMGMATPLMFNIGAVLICMSLRLRGFEWNGPSRLGPL